MYSFALRPGGLVAATAPGVISLRLITPAKAAYAATGNFFLIRRYVFSRIISGEKFIKKE